MAYPFNPSNHKAQNHPHHKCTSQGNEHWAKRVWWSWWSKCRSGDLWHCVIVVVGWHFLMIFLVIWLDAFGGWTALGRHQNSPNERLLRGTWMAPTHWTNLSKHPSPWVGTPTEPNKLTTAAPQGSHGTPIPLRLWPVIFGGPQCILYRSYLLYIYIIYICDFVLSTNRQKLLTVWVKMATEPLFI